MSEGIRNAQDPRVTGKDGPRARISALRIEKNPRHWFITVFNRGGNAGTLCIDAEDGQTVVNALIPPQLQFADDTV